MNHTIIDHYNINQHLASINYVYEQLDLGFFITFFNHQINITIRPYPLVNYYCSCSVC